MKIKQLKDYQKMTWKKAKDMLIPEAQTFWIILKTYIAKICGNYCAELYFASKTKKEINKWKTIKLNMWASINYVIRIDVEPYLKSQ